MSKNDYYNGRDYDCDFDRYFDEDRYDYDWEKQEIVEELLREGKFKLEDKLFGFLECASEVLKNEEKFYCDGVMHYDLKNAIERFFDYKVSADISWVDIRKEMDKINKGTKTNVGLINQTGEKLKDQTYNLLKSVYKDLEYEEIEEKDRNEMIEETLKEVIEFFFDYKIKLNIWRKK